MKNLWTQEEAANYKSDLEQRVYTSNLLGRSDELVLHGGGNTSVKTIINGEDILLVKGSGWDLVSIKEEGFAPVKLDVLLEMAKLETLSDKDMVSQQKVAMINKEAPNPSVEAILHALIPFKFVDHTHADAVVTISNTTNGIKLIKELYPNFLIIPYVMPGFILAKQIYDDTRGYDWDKCEGIILHNHGIFTFDEHSKEAYDKMIAAVSLAEDFLEKNTCIKLEDEPKINDFDYETLKEAISLTKGFDVTLHINQSPLALHYASQNKLREKVTQGLLTPEHIIRTKRNPLVLEENQNIQEELQNYIIEYKKYFESFKTDEICLNSAPNYAVIQNVGVVTFGKNEKEASIINDIVSHTLEAVLKAANLGAYKAISLKDCFEMEYWELEQIKLKKK